MKRVRVNIKSSLAQVFGKNIKSASYVLLILFLISWAGDLLLSLITDLTYFILKHNQFNNSERAIITPVILLILCFIGFVFLYRTAKVVNHSDPYNVTDEDVCHKKRETIIITLSPHKAYDHKVGDIKKPSHKIENFIRYLSYLPSNTEIKDIQKTPFNCNWLPPIQAIKNYPNLKKVIVLGTTTKHFPGKDDDIGSFEQIKHFKTFVNHYFEGENREIEIVDHHESNLIKDEELNKKCSKGIDADNAADFAWATLRILDSLDKEHENDNPRYLEEKLVIDVTSGKSSMSASLAAVSGSKGIFLHYTDTHTMKSHVLDVNID